MDVQEKNRLANVYRKECETRFHVGSPYRIDEYIRLRMRGMSPEKAIEKVKQPTTKEN